MSGLTPPRIRPALVGRRNELAQLKAALDDALAGRGRLVLLAGEAGIGKTRLLEALVDDVTSRGAVAQWGRCWGGGGGPAYQPWRQVLHGQAATTPTDVLARHLGAGAAEVARIVPEVLDRLPGLPAPGSSECLDARTRFFDSVASYLGNAAVDGGLVIALDDLHAADESSLRLLEHVVVELADTPVLIAGAYRDAAAPGSHGLPERFAGLGLRARRIVLRGLDEGEVAEFLARASGYVAPAFARQVLDATDGNPFILREVVRLRQTEAAGGALPLPEEVAAVIERRLQAMSSAAREVLDVAAVIGREFDLTVMQGSVDMGAHHLLETLGEAAALGVVEEVRPGRWTFDHPVVGEAIYDQIRPSRRVTLHRRVGEALERLPGEHPGTHAAALAHHFFEAAKGGDGVKATEYCILTAGAAMTTLAFEEAAIQYGRALEAMSITADVDERLRFDLLMSLVEASMRIGNFSQARESGRRALRSARALGSPELLARAALGFSGERELGHDDGRARVLEEARTALTATDSPLLSRVLLALARALSGSRPPAMVAQLADEGLAVARRAGDPPTLRQALWEWHHLSDEPARVDERLAVADELIRLSTEYADSERLQLGRQCRAEDLFALGDLPGVRRELEGAAREVDGARLSPLAWRSAVQLAGVALTEGRHDEAERLAHHGLAAGERSGRTDVKALFAAQLWAIRREQGRFDEMADVARRIDITVHAAGPALWPLLSVALAELGTADDVRRELSPVVGEVLQSGELGRLAGPALVADACWIIGESRWAEATYACLQAWPDRHVVLAEAACSLGSSDRYLAQMACLLGWFDESDRHFEAAHRLHKHLGAPGWLAHGRFDHARMLLRRGTGGDAARARQLIDAARAGYRTLGMTEHEQRAARLLLQEADAAAPSGETGLFRLEGEYWAIDYHHSQARVRDSKGLRYLARLLKNPGVEVHALDLVVGDGRGSIVSSGPPRDAGLGIVSGDAGTVLDAKAKAAYKRRLGELHQEIAEAGVLGDWAGTDRAQREMDFLLAELSGAVGLGGRDRKAASDAERARQSVTRAIKGAIKVIGAAHPDLGEHLRTTIRTGTYSSYGPDPRASIRWTT